MKPNDKQTKRRESSVREKHEFADEHHSNKIQLCFEEWKYSTKTKYYRTFTFALSGWQPHRWATERLRQRNEKNNFHQVIYAAQVRANARENENDFLMNWNEWLSSENKFMRRWQAFERRKVNRTIPFRANRPTQIKTKIAAFGNDTKDARPRTTTHSSEMKNF